MPRTTPDRPWPRSGARRRRPAPQHVTRHESGLSAGSAAAKTQVIGTLLGFADLFPIRETPSTGNVTAIRARSDSSVRETKIEGSEVEFLSRD